MQQQHSEAPVSLWTKVDKTLRYHGARLRRFARGLIWDLRPRVAARPVFVVGCSRAGTTLVYKTFSEAAELGTLQRETHDFWAGLHPLQERGWDTHAIPEQLACDKDRREVARYFYRYTGMKRFADKNNQNSLNIPYLHRLFPDAFFIYVKRSPGDNINSLIEGWRRPEEFATWSRELPDEVAVESGKYRQWCFFLAQGWRGYTKENVEEVCAFQYRSVNEAILNAKRGIPAAQWYELRYEDILQDPVREFRAALCACGVKFNEDLERHCQSVLSRPYNAFSSIRLNKWRDGENKERIARVLPALAPLAARMGYRPEDMGGE